MIHIVTALPCEAKPLVHHYRLNGRQPACGFRIYENEKIDRDPMTPVRPILSTGI